MLLPLAQLVFFYGEMNLRADRAAMQWAERVLRAAPAQAIVLTERDAYTFTLWYARAAMQVRPDVIVLDCDLWAHAPYRQMMAREFGWADDLTLDQIAQRMDRPVIRVSDEEMH